MTMEIEIKNVSTNYVAEVTMMDQSGNPASGYDAIVLKPGEYTTVTVWDGHWPAVKEIGEAKVEEPISEEDSETNILWRDHSIKPEMCEGGWCLADYSGDVLPAGYCGISMLWSDVINVSDPFPTKDDAVTAGMSQIDVKAPKEKYQPPQAYREVPGDDPELKRLWEEKGTTVIRVKDGYFLAKYVDEDKELYCGESMKWVDKMDEVGDLFPTHEEAVKAGLAS